MTNLAPINKNYVGPYLMPSMGIIVSWSWVSSSLHFLFKLEEGDLLRKVRAFLCPCHYYPTNYNDISYLTTICTCDIYGME